MIFVDSNVPMYLIGAPHRHKQDAQRLLETAIAEDEKLVSDVEVLQEILDRYAAIGRRDAIQPAFDAVHGLVDEIFSIEVADVERAKAIVLERQRLSARDALHAAVMERHKITLIMSFDSGFDALPGVTRLK